MFAHDKGWVRKLEEAIRNGLTAEAAVEKVQSDTARPHDPRSAIPICASADDFDDLANRLLRELMGEDSSLAVPKLPPTRSSSPAPWARPSCSIIRARTIRGLVLEDGAATSHVVIVARAMGIPVVGQAKGIVALSENADPIIVDGEVRRPCTCGRSRCRKRLCGKGPLPRPPPAGVPRSPRRNRRTADGQNSTCR
jgi:phosphotransferase system enzyme I (PtsP)